MQVLFVSSEPMEGSKVMSYNDRLGELAIISGRITEELLYVM